ncbi:MAG: NAD(+)/NADH kinase [Desulfovibrio sp.]|nr:NAD(+)/NADH kinase [Desulfovibrio sp.]
MAAWLGQRKMAVRIAEAGASFRVDEQPDLVIIAGGDGTILGVARHFAGTAIPLLGINCGRVGFLTAAAAADWQTGLELALKGQLANRSCLALAWLRMRDGAIINEGIAINDVVVARGSLARLATLNLAVNGEELGSLRCDGLIISSPLGSSGYFASAGGAVLHPDLAAFGIAAICPFRTEFAPLILPGDFAACITVNAESGDSFLTIDGQLGHELARREEVVVKGLPGAIHLLGTDTGYFRRLRPRATRNNSEREHTWHTKR